MFTSTNPSPQPSPRLDGERELFPFGAGVWMQPEEAGGAKFAGVRHGMFHVAGAFSRVDNFRTRTGQPPDFFRQRIDRNGLGGTRMILLSQKALASLRHTRCV